MKEKKGILIAGAAVLLLVAACLWYARPMELEQLCPGLDRSGSGGVSALYTQRRTHPDGKVDSIPRAVEFPDGPSAAQALFRLIETRHYHRSPAGLLPWMDYASYVNGSSGDLYSWSVVVLGEGSVLRLYGASSGMYLEYTPADSPRPTVSVLCAADDQESFEQLVYSFLSEYAPDEVVNTAY